MDNIFLKNSKVASLIYKAFSSHKGKAGVSVKSSFFVRLIQSLGENFRVFPVRTVSTIILPLLAFNLLWALISGYKMEASELAIKLLLLFILSAGLFCRANWIALKKGSHVLKFINNTCKTRA